MTNGNVKSITHQRIVHAARLTNTTQSRDHAEKAMQLAYFLTIIETMLAEGTPAAVSRKDLTELVALARQKADALCQSLAELSSN
ncbi:MAG: hypothetical protein V3T39_05010 [Gammaproteobacteria bacterium]